MTITKGSRAAHERSLKAAETRRRNQSNQPRKASVTKPLKQKRPLALSKIRTASVEELREAFALMQAPGYRKQRGDDKRYYALKDELRARADPNLSLYLQREGLRKVGSKPLKKRQQRRVSAKQPRPEGSKPHRREDLYNY